MDNNVTPNGLKCYVEPSIGNRDEDFLKQWHGILDDCSKNLINCAIDWSVKTIESTKTEIATLTEKLKALVSEPTYKDIASSLKKNEETRTKDLVQRKNRKFYQSKYGERD